MFSEQYSVFSGQCEGYAGWAYIGNCGDTEHPLEQTFCHCERQVLIAVFGEAISSRGEEIASSSKRPMAVYPPSSSALAMTYR
jgi:hypothetical protein